MILSHYSPAPWTFDPERTYDQAEFGNGKPRGLWLSDDSDHGWKAWCESEEWNLGGLENVTTFTLAPGADVLHLASLAEIRAFTAEYAGHPAYLEKAPDLARRYIDWPRVAAEHDGILITPYQWGARLDRDTFWYYGWDCASGCFWNLRAVTPAPDPRERAEYIAASAADAALADWRPSDVPLER
ncbi:hypothetical protein [Microbacterium phage MO526]|uniref:RES domain-containing protein n=1 Tax=Microbacterium phage MO526 TaxID=3108092 RepID=A0ABZ0ZXG0_9CAUD|nr:hypothetical protein [Microbacterium phage MO526]